MAEDRAEAAWPEGTYLEWRLHLYEIRGWEDREVDGYLQRALLVVNCLNEYPLWLSMLDLREATPVPLTPDAPPEDWKLAAA